MHKMGIWWDFLAEKILATICKRIFVFDRKSLASLWRKTTSVTFVEYNCCAPTKMTFESLQAPLEMSAYQLLKLISQPIHMLWILKRTISISTQNNCLNNIHNFMFNFFVNLNSSCKFLDLFFRNNFFVFNFSKMCSRWKVFRNISANFSKWFQHPRCCRFLCA